jgi:hypothetical protein
LQEAGEELEDIAAMFLEKHLAEEQVQRHHSQLVQVLTQLLLELVELVLVK